MLIVGKTACDEAGPKRCIGTLYFLPTFSVNLKLFFKNVLIFFEKQKCFSKKPYNKYINNQKIIKYLQNPLREYH